MNNILILVLLWILIIRNFLDEDEITNKVDIIKTQAAIEDDIEDSYLKKIFTEYINYHS